MKKNVSRTVFSSVSHYVRAHKIVSGVLGMGCAACGSFLLTSIFSLFGASWLLSYLPLDGGEFGILGVILLAVSLYLTAKKIQNPAVCKI